MSQNKRHIALVLARIALGCLAIVSLSAFRAPVLRLPDSSAMPLAAPARAPLAYMEYCSARADDCFGAPLNADAKGRPDAIIAARNSVSLRNGGGSSPRRGLRFPRLPNAPAGMVDGAALFEISADPKSANGEIGEAVHLDRKMWRLINQVHRDINGAIAFTNDDELHNAADVWSLPLTEPTGGQPRGDCEDYMLEKRRALRAAGVPAAALSPAVVVLPDGRWHAVLVVATDRGDYVLDNRHKKVLPWRELDYFWITRETNARADQWRFVSNFGK